MSYLDFIDSKLRLILPDGIQPPEKLNSALFDFQQEVVSWALKRGRCAIFADCGLGKTLMQLEWAHHIPGRVLILTPLAVAEQTIREGARFGIACGNREGGEKIVVCNYEQLHKVDTSLFDAVVLDESSILKSFDGKTRQQLIDTFKRTPYRLCCSATPAPNDFMELGNHSEFLGVMSATEMLAMFFVHDGGETQKWRLKGHARRDFWQWVNTWAVSLRRPSDLGYSDGGFKLPELIIQNVTVKADYSQAQGTLFPLLASSLSERRDARRQSLSARVQAAADIVTSAPNEQWLIWCDYNNEADALAEAISDAVEIRGSDKSDDKARRMLDFAAGKIRVLITKPSIAGFGMNWQNCAHMIFVGLSDSYEQFYQATRRCWRFGQKRDVSVFIVTSELEQAVVKNVERKDAEARVMSDELSKLGISGSVGNKITAAQAIQKESDNEGEFTAYLGDCVDVCQLLDSDSIDYSIFSPPFSSLYTYTDSPRDMGNCTGDEQFFEHFQFLVAELYRVIAPGRLLSFHCMNLPTSKANHGVIGIRDFRGLLIRTFEQAGFIYHSEVCIWKDPVTAMQRTKALGLLHKQLKKDACMSRQGIPDYLVTMRKPGENKKPVANTNESFPVFEWQQYASPVWMDINPSDTLQYRSAREHDDERHICPLQLQVIRRAIRLWTRTGDVVFSPFMGIGSEGYVALGMERLFIGAELKESYFKQSVANLKAAISQRASLFDADDMESVRV